ncbi:MAG: glycoside hydrolase family 140 protein [Niabella sp.]|nr:glycoside hydrolase family 140 protein [Niabella sp.]
MKRSLAIAFLCSFFSVTLRAQQLPSLQVAADHHYFQTADGKPFFWLGDTGWLLFLKCTREEAQHYLDVRQQQGFNVIQAMVLHTVAAKNVYGDFAVANGDVSKPIVTNGADFKDSAQYDFWDHVEFIINEAAKRGIYMALVPVWGSNVKEGKVSTAQAAVYARFLANRFKKYTNIIWMNGGDIPGDEHMEVWNTIGTTLKKYDPAHLVTFHPRGRYSSSDWFHNKTWLDFNMVQSGHRNYAQDTTTGEKHHYGEDNWKYIKNDRSLVPVKPVLDGEPSYEHIPQGLHDSRQPKWTAADVRRYAYWSVFAGAAGFTYGDNAVMQFYAAGEKNGSYGVQENWKAELTAPGATQMQFVKELVQTYDYFSRVPAQELVVNNNRSKYDYILATKGKGYAMAYTYTGKRFSVDLSKLGFKPAKAKWYIPASGKYIPAQLSKATGVLSFAPPAAKADTDGTDRVLVLEK